MAKPTRSDDWGFPRWRPYGGKGRAAARVDELVMEIPIRGEIARYFYQYRGRCGDDRWMGRIPRAGLEKGKEVTKEGLEKTQEAASEFKKGWEEGAKKE